jgi:hypothetical protein
MVEIAYKSVIFVNISVKYITSLSFDLCHNKTKSHFCSLFKQA